MLILVSVLLLFSCRSPASGSVLSSPNFIVRFDSVDIGLAREVVDRAERALVQVSSQLGHELNTKTVIVIASSEQDFTASVQGETPEWGLAFAFCGEGKIVLKSPRLVRRNIELNTVVTHEVSHIVLCDFLGGQSIPLWLNEGFAMYQSKEWVMGNSAVVGWAALTKGLYGLDELEDVFPWSAEGAKLAYAESFLAVAFIIQQFGKDGLDRLLRDLSSGLEIDTAMRNRFGIGYARFKREWMKYTTERFSVLSFLLSPATLWSIVIGLVVIVYVRKRRQRNRILDDDEVYVVQVDQAWFEADDDS